MAVKTRRTQMKTRKENNWAMGTHCTYCGKTMRLAVAQVHWPAIAQVLQGL